MENDPVVYLARTPLQALNCLEAKRRFHEDDNNILIFIYRKPSDRKTVESFVKSDEFSTIHYQPLKPKHTLFRFWLRLFKEQTKIEHMYIGDSNHLMNYFINRMDIEKFTLVDDGTATVKLASLIAQRRLNSVVKAHPERDKHPFKVWLNRTLGLHRDFFYKADLFTMYHIDEPHLQSKVIDNDYREFKKRLKPSSGKEVLFLGSNMGDTILKEPQRYGEILEKVVEHYGAENFTYVLHPKQSIEAIDELSKKLGFHYVKFEGIIETKLLQRELPAETASFISTGVSTLHKMYGIEGTIFKVPHSYLKEEKIETFEAIYAQFETLGLTVSPIE